MQLEDAEKLIRLARKSIEYFLATGTILDEKPPNKKFEEKRGVFVTLLKFPSNELRGCIGFVESPFSLWKAVINAAVSAAFYDPRFMPLQAKELDSIIIELSLLTKPHEIKSTPNERPKRIKIGKHGLIIKSKDSSGLLLPQVATEYSWDAREFLEHLCLKAGLNKDCWQSKETKLFAFEAEIFREEKPNGKVILPKDKEDNFKENI